jgi:acyl carrier protein
VNASPTIEAQIRSFVAENLLYDPNGFTYPDDASFLREGIIDSLGVMQLVEFVQSRFRVAVEPAEVTPENFDSVARLARFIGRKLPAGGPAPS